VKPLKDMGLLIIAGLLASIVVLSGCVQDSPVIFIKKGSTGVSGLDTNWQTSWTTFDANMKTTYNLPATGGVDTNWQTSWVTFDSNMINTYRKYAIDINTSQNIDSDKNIRGNMVKADVNFIIGMDGNKGYIRLDSNCLVLGVYQ
jgi:hypothetical protein